ncbi:siderophore-interacting protein [Paeniglutamicibacter sp. ABSL32-1]|uniref:siderophore-interacting protein n=1 Tax=Paeniglutamicibacter quisquiliarum TaxID=2849498 RepID=UPI001C2D9F4E|nr:siderophore-interacting protein [Paeniglutamicibacter quisquiliarum]MBV1781099.1 siderophore-interacting protein [Paeniglutamicibacter quisquiliarum]
MSHHKKRRKPCPEAESLATEHARVFEAAVEAGRRAGRKAAKRKLKRAARYGGLQLSKPLRESVLRDAEKAGGRAAYAAATKALRRAGSRMALAPAPGHAAADFGSPTGAGPAAGAVAAPPRRMPGSQVVMDVLRVERPSRSMVRIVAGGEGFDDFESNGAADQYVKLYFTNPSLGLLPPYDLRSLRKSLRREDFPASRSYTIRRHDPVARELAIEFFIHEPAGPAAAWAAAAQPGDQLVLSRPKGKFRPDPKAEQHLYAADDTGIPAIAAALERLPRTASGRVFLEVEGPEDEQEFDLPLHMELTWLHRNGEPAASSNLLSDALRDIPAPHGRVEVLALGGRDAVRDIRKLASHWDIEQRRIHVSSYWTARRPGRTWPVQAAAGPRLEAGQRRDGTDD